MSNYKYQGQNINQIANVNQILAPSTTNTANISFPQYGTSGQFGTYQTSNYTSTDRPLPFSFKTSSGEISNAYPVVASFIDITAPAPPATVSWFPDWTDKIHVIAIGGGGGKGGSGGCGWDSSVPTHRYNGGGGGPGAAGQYIYLNDENYYPVGSSNYSNNYNWQIGTAGNNGNNGDRHPNGSSGSGQDGGAGGQGNATTLSFYSNNSGSTLITIGAIGGGGGSPGPGGNAGGSNNTVNTNVSVPNNTYPGNPPSATITYYNNGNGANVSLPSNYNPIGYLTNKGNPGQNGALRIYFLKS